MAKKIIYTMLLTGMLGIMMVPAAFAQDGLTVSTGVDFYNRYIWRGLDIANTPSAQPSIALGYNNFEFGIWGAYTLSNQSSESDEIDFWLSYSHQFEQSLSFSLMVTDYYFPNAGIEFFNFNNYDAETNGVPDPGAHTLEAGVAITGPESFPITVSAFMNVYNDEGNNVYIQLDYPVMVGETELGLFVGMTPGCDDNPDYYGTDEFKLINVGVQTSREITISDSFSLPLNLGFIVNPNEEISHLLVGTSF